MSQRLRRLAITFLRTSMRPIPRKSPFYFVIMMTVLHMHYLAIVISWNPACTMATTFRQLVASGESSRIAAIIH